MTALASQDLEVLAVADIFARGRYVVPVYQRAYAWGEDQILTLLQDVRDYRLRKASSYYIGSLVTHRSAEVDSDEDVFEVVDGQQRLITLFIILRTLSQAHDILVPSKCLSYEGRPGAAEDLALLERKGHECVVGDLSVAGFRVAVETVRSAYKAGQFTDEDLAYLIDHVKIVRTTLPERTDLNHYFEVMNSRGEQLEKHEIVKAHLMSLLDDSDDADARSHAFAVVWDACSDMSRHVQAKFPAGKRDNVRGAIFGTTGDDAWDEFRASEFGDIVEAVRINKTIGLQETTLSKILESGTTGAQAEAKGDDALERYGAIIDFPNFLLHVLALSDADRAGFVWNDMNSAARVSLDDKKLVEQFKSRITTSEQAENFAFTLLRARYLFDKYVIKTDLTRAAGDDSNWVLVRVRKLGSSSDGKLSPVSTFRGEDEQDESWFRSAQWHVIMLQSMFQVTDSRRAYKNFLYAILDYLYRQGGTNANDFTDFLQGLARDRYTNTVDSTKLHEGTSVPHFALNYLDYLLWLDLHDGKPVKHLDAGAGSGVSGYRFRYRTSVEHFYPQHPGPDSRIERLPQADVDQFGNLCLLTRSENSMRSNLAPVAKVGEYRTESQTLKFRIMANMTEKHSGWTLEQIKEHGADMRDILEAAVGGAASAQGEPTPEG